MKALYNMSYEELQKLIKEELQIDGWLIFDGGASARSDRVSNRCYYQTLKQKAEAEGISASKQEVLSWLDTLNLLYYSLSYVNEKILEKMRIIQEYQIPFTRKRADYLLVFENRILIIEFSFDKLGEEYRFETKLSQAVNYKELLSNLLPEHIKIGTYTFLINPEIDQQGKDILKYNRYTKSKELANNEKIRDLGEFITVFFSNKNDALLQLGYLDGYEKALEDSL